MAIRWLCGFVQGTCHLFISVKFQHDISLSVKQPSVKCSLNNKIIIRDRHITKYKTHDRSHTANTATERVTQT